VVDGRDLAALEAAMKGEEFKGTVIDPVPGSV
jgi:hypothetical protein